MPLWAPHLLLAVGWGGLISSKISASLFKGTSEGWHGGDLKALGEWQNHSPDLWGSLAAFFA